MAKMGSTDPRAHPGRMIQPGGWMLDHRNFRYLQSFYRAKAMSRQLKLRKKSPSPWPTRCPMLADLATKAPATSSAWSLADSSAIIDSCAGHLRTNGYCVDLVRWASGSSMSKCLVAGYDLTGNQSRLEGQLQKLSALPRQNFRIRKKQTNNAYLGMHRVCKAASKVTTVWLRCVQLALQDRKTDVGSTLLFLLKITTLRENASPEDSNT